MAKQTRFPNRYCPDTFVRKRFPLGLFDLAHSDHLTFKQCQIDTGECQYFIPRHSGPVYLANKRFPEYPMIPEHAVVFQAKGRVVRSLSAERKRNGDGLALFGSMNMNDMAPCLTPGPPGRSMERRSYV